MNTFEKKNFSFHFFFLGEVLRLKSIWNICLVIKLAFFFGEVGKERMRCKSTQRARTREMFKAHAPQIVDNARENSNQRKNLFFSFKCGLTRIAFFISFFFHLFRLLSSFFFNEVSKNTCTIYLYIFIILFIRVHYYLLLLLFANINYTII